MAWNLYSAFICPNYHPPPNCSSMKQTMWAHHPIFYSCHIFSLWSNYIIYYFIISENLPGHDHTYVTYLHQIWAHFIYPISLTNFSKFKSREEHCEGSITLHVQIVSIFYSGFLCPNNHPPPNFSSIHSLFWAQLQHAYFCSVWNFAKQVPPRVLHLSWKFVKTVFLVDDHPQSKLTPIGHVHFPYR
jgi:hypothetical protein